MLLSLSSFLSLGFRLGGIEADNNQQQPFGTSFLARNDLHIKAQATMTEQRKELKRKATKEEREEAAKVILQLQESGEYSR